MELLFVSSKVESRIAALEKAGKSGKNLAQKATSIIDSLACGFVSLVVFAFLTNLVLGQFKAGFAGQPVAHTQHVWDFSGMNLAGLAFALAGGCPGRQLFLSGEGDGDAAVFVLGMIVGAGFAHNFGLASSPKGIGPHAVAAVIIGLLVRLFIGFSMRRKSA
jgi:YedE family putative selenium metabolism protein